MNTSKQIAKHLYEVYFGGNWTTCCLKDVLENVNWEEAMFKIKDFNSISTLIYHVNYFSRTVSEVLEGKTLNSKDALSFNLPLINSEKDWQGFLDQVWIDGKHFSELIEKVPEEKLFEPFVEEKYGIYYRNLHGIIEHLHYHLGQIVIIKKIIKNEHA